MQSTNLVSEIAVALSALLIAVLFLSRSKRSLPLPPGPQGKWIIGNLLQWPISKEWETFGKWAEEYGELNCHPFEPFQRHPDQTPQVI